MAYTTDANGIPILEPKSLLSDVPAYTKALAPHIQALTEQITANLIPVGSIQAYMGTTAPDYWLLCDGKSYDAAYFDDLSKVNGNFHGDGVFRVPDLRGRAPVGVATGLNNGAAPAYYPRNLGDRDGDWRMPSHAHRLTSNQIFDPGGNPGWAIPPLNGISNPNGPLAGGVGIWEPVTITGQGSAHGFGISPMNPCTGVNFIVYAGKPTKGIVGGGAIAPKSTRDMIEQRLTEVDVDKEEREMLEARLASEPRGSA